MLPEEVEILRRIWEQRYVEIEGGVRVLDPEEMPKVVRRVESLYETEARYTPPKALRAGRLQGAPYGEELR